MFLSSGTAPRRGAGVSRLVAAACALVSVLPAQTRLDWRHIGNTAVDASLAGVATGPVNRVWYSEDGARLFAQTSSGRIFVTTDFETWAVAPDVADPPASSAVGAQRRPETTAKLVRASIAPARVYAAGKFAYRSDDDGVTWSNLTGFKNESIVGGGVTDIAVSPRNPDDVTVASQAGVWRSVDAGLSWSGLNDALPNLQVRRILGVPDGTRGMRVAIADASAWEWAPGEKHAWAAYSDKDLEVESDLRGALSIRLQSTITAVAVSGDAVYAGSADGLLWSSSDRGRTWTKSPDVFSGSVNRIWVDAREPRLALAALGEPRPDAPDAKSGRVLRTINGGGFWDDITAGLPDGSVNGVVGDRTTGAVYAATDRGLFMTYGDLVNAGPATPWAQLRSDLPETVATDVALDAAGNQLYAAFDGYGVYAAPAPHRSRDPKVVSAADFLARPAAPGALISILGANVRTASAGTLNAPVLGGGESRTDIQVPFNATGSSVPLSFETPEGARTVGIALKPTSPAIFVDRDGAPMLLDGDSGVMLDAMTPAHSNGRVQILATGLGRVRPDWPAGVPAPADTTLRVAAAVKAYLDREPVEVTRAVLAPGYVGFYLVEIEMPKIVNYGPAELYIEADGQSSNRVRVYIQP